MADRINIGVLLSGKGSNLQAIMDACEANRIDGKVVFVGSDNPRADGLKRAKEYGIPTFVVDYKAIIEDAKGRSVEDLAPDDFDLVKVLASQRPHMPIPEKDALARYLSTRAIAEDALLKAMAPYPFDLLVLAGFMRVLSPYFLDKVNVDPQRPCVMNIHAAILPSFPGVDGYGDTYRYGCKVGGCTVHFVDYGEDTGAIIGQEAFEIKPEDTLETIKSKGLKLEWALYPACIQLFAENRLKVVAKIFTLANGQRFSRKWVTIAR